MTNRETLAPKAYRLTLAKQLFREIIIYLMMEIIGLITYNLIIHEV